jgi:signal transduction histidine kinase
MLEDNPDDAELAQRRLRQDGLSFRSVVVHAEASFTAQLAEFRPHVILADYSLPGFSGEEALKMAVRRCPHVPFIILSGALGEEAAVGLIKQGAWDFLLKDRPGRLPLAVRQAIAEADRAAQMAQMEAQLHQEQQMATVGRLAAAVAHEFNNQVAIMLNYASFIRDEVGRHGEDHPQADYWATLRDDTDQIMRAGEKVTAVVAQLLAAGGRQITRPEVVTINELVTGLETQLRSMLGQATVLRLDPGTGLWPVRADPGQLRQVLLSLATNAHEAMPEGGTFSIATSNMRLAQAPGGPGDPALPSGCYVMISARDTGIGMPQEVLEHCLESYFTTKPFVAGGGLGLALAFGIIRQAGGDLRISSAPGEGTDATIWLPALETGPQSGPG